VQVLQLRLVVLQTQEMGRLAHMDRLQVQAVLALSLFAIPAQSNTSLVEP
jgi:hypothetical protein